MKMRGRILSTSTLFVIILAFTLQFVVVNASAPTWHTHEELVNMHKTLCDSHPEHASYETIGKTYEGRDIVLFKIGNPNGGRVMWDGTMHGWEDVGGEIIYFTMEWLFTSGEQAAQRILERNYLLFIPVINVDSYERQNRNFEQCRYGVDLNRNFKTGWRKTACGDYPNCYHGDYAASETETQAVRYVFEHYRPDFYMNIHDGGGPWLAGDNSQVSSRISEISSQRHVTPFPYHGSSGGGNGIAVADARAFGASAWLLEVEGGSGCYSHTEYSLSDVENIYTPKCLPILITMCEACENGEPPLPPPTRASLHFGWCGYITTKAEVIPLLDKLKADGWNAIRYQSVPEWAPHDGNRVPINYNILDHLVDEADKRGMTVYLLCAHAWQPSTGEGGSGNFIDGHEQEWISDFRSIAQRYAGHNIVIDAWSEYSSSQGKSRYQSLAQMFLDDFRSHGLNMLIYFNVWWNSPLFALNDPENNYSEGRHHYGGFLDNYNPSTPIDFETACEESGVNGLMRRYFEENNNMYVQEAERLGIPYVISEMGGSDTPSTAYGGKYSMSVGNIAYAKKMLELGQKNNVTCIMHRIGWLSDYDLYYRYSQEYFGEKFWEHTPSPPPVEYELTIEVSGSGTTDPVPDTYTYPKDSAVPVQALPDPGWILSHWLRNGGNTGSVNPYTVTMDDNYELTAVFVEVPYVFEDGFESSDFSRWTGIATRGATATVVDTLPYQGSYHGRFASNGNDQFEHAYCYKTVDEEEVYARGYFYIASGLPLENDDDRFYFIRFREGQNYLAVVGIRRHEGSDKWVLYGRNGSGVVGPIYAVSPSIETNRWYCIELHWKKHAQYGTVEAYVDGERILVIDDVDTANFGNVREISFGLISALEVQESLDVYGDGFALSKYGKYIGPYRPGDINCDGFVNILDLSIASLSVGSVPGDSRWNPNADLNRDGIINIIDLVIVAMNFDS